jgi:uncharacterized LabA/DUF88 family protein
MAVPERPDKLRVVVFIDGQNFYNECRRIFRHGETHPHLLGEEICGSQFGTDRVLQEVRFYTGIHDSRREPLKNSYMQKRIRVMKQNDVTTFSRPLKYGEEIVEDRGQPGTYKRMWKGREKGVDVRIALDMVMMAVENKYEIASLASNDSDLEEAINDVFEIRQVAEKWMTVENVVCCQVDRSTGIEKPLPTLDSDFPMRIIPVNQAMFDRIRDDTNYWT